MHWNFLFSPTLFFMCLEVSIYEISDLRLEAKNWTIFSYNINSHSKLEWISD